MSPEFSLQTKRLLLRPLNHPDVNQLVKVVKHSAPSLSQWLDWCSKDFNQDDAEELVYLTKRHWITDSGYDFGIFDKKTGQLYGSVGVNCLQPVFNMANLGYWVSTEVQGKAIATEAAIAAANFCFSQLGFTRLEIICDQDNAASLRVAEKCGAQVECVARNRIFYQGKPRTGVVYSLIPEDIEALIEHPDLITSSFSS